jgi:uncharacterized membrane protein YgcG
MKARAALAAAATLAVTLAATVVPAFAARSSYVIDDAHMLSQSTIDSINQRVGDFNAQTGKEVVVVTTPSLDGTSPNAALERSFAQQQVNGVEIFIAKNEHQIKIAGDVASRKFFPSGSFTTIYQAMKPSFQQGNFDQGVLTGVDLVLNTYRGHTSSLNAGRRAVPAGAGTTHSTQSSSGGFSMGWIVWLIILAVIFFIIRGIFRAMAGPRMYGPGPGYGGPGYGPGYGGPGYGYGGGGGGFWSGLLGGLGGAWLGNELFGGRRDYGGGGEGGSWAATGGTDPGTASDAGGWQSDAGQIDTGSIGGGGWDSGGGDSGGGWGGGDGGGGGGDSGGGW